MKKPISYIFLIAGVLSLIFALYKKQKNITEADRIIVANLAMSSIIIIGIGAILFFVEKPE